MTTGSTSGRWPSIPALVADAARRFGAAVAVDGDDAMLTFDELHRSVLRSATALVASGVQPGDRIGLWAPNTAAWVTTALGIHTAGSVLVPVNTRFRGREAADVLRRSRATHLFTTHGFLDTDYVGMVRAEGDLPDLREIVVMHGSAPAGTVDLAGFLRHGDDPAAASTAAARAAAVDADDLCHILFTSGTTGRPKGVMLAHGPVCAVYETLADVCRLREGDRQLVVIPFFHSFGLHVGILCSLAVGMTIVPHTTFEPVEVMRTISEHRITVFPGPPTVFHALAHHPDRDRYDLSSLRQVTIGAASIPPTIVADVRTRLGVERITAGYGLTESSGTVSLVPPDGDPSLVVETDGAPIPGVQVRIVDNGGADVDLGASGEILVRGYNVMRGYLDDPDATSAAIDEADWLRTGDIGHLRADGYLVVTDRKKDLFVSGGFNVSPAEVEAVLLEHPAIAQVAVVGAPDDHFGEVGVAFVVAADRADPDDVIAWARERMANFKVPRRVVLVDELPLNASGKVLKGHLRATLAPGV